MKLIIFSILVFFRSDYDTVFKVYEYEIKTGL